MSVITFWSNGKEESGKSSAVAAISTFMGVHHNYKILVIDTKYKDTFYTDCYWRETKKSAHANKAFTGIGEGISGLARAVLSNKVSPEIVTNYTKIVFNDNRLEILLDSSSMKDEFNTHKKVLKDIIKIANQYYDLVIVDLDKSLDQETVASILQVTDLVVACLPQRLRTINKYAKAKKEKDFLLNKPVLTLIGRYDEQSKYSQKIITKFLKEKQGVVVIPYNTLYMETCNEAKVDDFFMKYTNINKKDKNSSFVAKVSEAAEKIVLRLQELQMRK